MGFCLPDWLTANFLQSCLRTDETNFGNIEVTRFSVEHAVPAGNNYGSQLFRVKLNYKKSVEDDCEYSFSLIIKAPLVAGFIEKIGGEFSNEMYKKEPNYYNKFITETYRLSKHDIVPKHYKSQNPLVLVLEDLKNSEYVMADRHELLDKEHCELYILASAKLHALSIAVNQTNPEIIQSLVFEGEMFKAQAKAMFSNMLSKSLSCMIAYLEETPDCKQYSDVLKQFSIAEIVEAFDQMEKADGKLKAVVQTDPWCTNMMFKYDETKQVSKIKLLDFQGLKFVTPVTELVTFCWASVKPEVREQHLTGFYKLYCDSINKQLEELKCAQRLSLQDLTEDLVELSPLILMVVCCMVPFCIFDGVGDINAMLMNDDASKPIKETSMYELYKGKTFNKYYPMIIKQAAKEGVFKNLKKQIEKLHQK